MVARSATSEAAAVTVSLDELKAGCVSSHALEEGLGPSPLGVIIVKDLPAQYAELRLKLLSYSSYLANLPDEDLAKLECPSAKWLVGWSCGKETLKDGRYDTFKGSYYVNCAFNRSHEDTRVHDYPNFPEYTSPNIWPAEDVLPGFQRTFRALCTLVIEIAALVARACDQYALKHVERYQPGYLEHVVRSGMFSKARLLHYFPPKPSKHPDTSDAQSGDEDDWCATHVDHGCLTGLTSAMFVDEDAYPPTQVGSSDVFPLPELDALPDPRAGLYIHSRSGEVVKVSVPRDCLAFQTGQALEVITSGKFKAVPHFVRGPAPGRGGKVARNTLAVFTQPNLWDMVDEERDFATFAREIVSRNH